MVGDWGNPNLQTCEIGRSMVPTRLCSILLFKGSYKKYFLSLLVSLAQGTAAALPPNLQLDRVPQMRLFPSLALNGYLLPHRALIFNTVQQSLRTQTLS